jgi:hypothetical protein
VESGNVDGTFLWGGGGASARLGLRFYSSARLDLDLI